MVSPLQDSRRNHAHEHFVGTGRFQGQERLGVPAHDCRPDPGAAGDVAVDRLPRGRASSLGDVRGGAGFSRRPRALVRALCLYLGGQPMLLVKVKRQPRARAARSSIMTA
jgi:hypothetical protein